MSYDLYVVPADACTDHASVEAHVDAQVGKAPDAVAAGIAAAITARNSPDDELSFLSIHPLQAEGDVVHVPAPFSQVQRARDAVIEAAIDAGFGVYDPQNMMVIDPRQAATALVESSSDRNYPLVSAAMVTVLAHRMRVNDHLIVEVGDQLYMQSARSADTYVVELRAGSADRHFAMDVGSPDDVARTIGLWLAGKMDELRALPWEKVNF
ncbi:hypothetical protein [Pseudactinotalea sp.]|uniref:hypothetical protein n=1 Tax=Pseudactinotalea sp. TaxID=1926260 RepID=UPI003B3A2BAC